MKIDSRQRDKLVLTTKYLNTLPDDRILDLIPKRIWRNNTEILNFSIQNIRDFGYKLPVFNLSDGNDYCYDIITNKYYITKERD